ncbi:MAG: sigma-70 family RNA polymerase sigma factor [Bacteroidota bacterium]
MNTESKYDREPEISDLEWVRKYQETGDQQAVVHLMRRYSAYVVAFGYRHMKDRERLNDFSQDLFVKLCDKLKTAEVRNFKSWLSTVMRNMFYDQSRRTHLHHRFLDHQKNADQSYEIETDMDKAAQHAELLAAIEQLNPDEARCVRLIYLEEKDYKEVMAKTGWTFNQVRGYRQRGMRKLKSMLNQYAGNHGNQ